MKGEEFPHERSGNESENVLYMLQSRLLDAWTKGKVEDYYQNIVLQYLDSLPLLQAQEHIAKEIKDINQGRSFYYKLASTLQQRKKSLSTLEQLIGHHEPTKKVDSQSLTVICEELNSLRDNNLGFAETLMHLYRELSQQESQSQVPVSDQCMQMMRNLDSDNEFLKESFLKDFVLFQQGYDPFFLHHYEMKGRQTPNCSSPIIDQLFTLSLSYACRLFKAKNQLVQTLSKRSMDKTRTPLPTPLHNLRKNKRKAATLEEPEEQPETRNTSINFRRKNFSLGLGRSREATAEAFQTINTHSQSLHLANKPTALRRIKTETEEKPALNPLTPQLVRLRDQVHTEDDDKGSFNRYRITKRVPIANRNDSAIQEQEAKKLSLSGPDTPKIFKVPRRKLTDEQHNRDAELPAKTINFGHRRVLHPLSKGRHPSMNASSMGDSRADDFEPEQISVPQFVSRMNTPSPDHPSRKSTQQQFESSKSNQSKLSRRSLVVEHPSLKQPIKMRPGRYSLPQLLQAVKTMKIRQDVKEFIQNPKWEESLKKFQTYVSEFVVGGDVKILAIALLLPDGDYLVKLWGPTEDCPSDLSISLFRKYLDYLEKMTTLKQIHYNGPELRETAETGFILKKERAYFRPREAKLCNKVHEYPQFLSLKCSNIVVPQDDPTTLFISEQIQPFSSQNSFSLHPVTTANRTALNENLQMHIKISEDITNMETLNKLLEDEDLDTYGVSADFNISNIRALRLNLNSPFSLPFTTIEGWLRLQGILAHRSDKGTVCMALCTLYNMKVYFGKGFSSFQQFLGEAKAPKVPESCEFSVKMFSKQLYGCLDRSGSEGYYGYWQVNLIYDDELPGRTRHSSKGVQFGPEPFMVGLQIESQLVYGFTVSGEDFLS